MWLRALAACALFAGVAAGASAAPSVQYDVTVRIDPATRALDATATIAVTGTVADQGPLRIVLASGFTGERLQADGRMLPAPSAGRDGYQVWSLPAGHDAHALDVRWHGTLAPVDRTITHRQTLDRPVATAGLDGTFLPAGSFWYPVIVGPDGPLLASYRVTLDVPAGERGIVPGRLVAESEADGRYHATFAFEHPAEGIDLIAGPYRVEARTVHTAGGSTIALRTYFHPAIAGLAPAYLDAVKGYLDLYERWIGPYPFTEFSVVSSPTPTGFGMPTLTYLGESVLKLPFIRATSLGHEVLHNWWGNGVYPDARGGNWSEGLTTFMADYAYKAREGPDAAREMRLGWLRDLAAVPPGQDRPLAEFAARRLATSQIVGYDKAAMLFVMLRDEIGTAAFDEGVRRFWSEHRFRVASWRDLQAAFAAAAGRDLGPFFTQWLERTGVPSVRVVGAERRATGDRYAIRVTIEQGVPPYALRVPVRMRTVAGDETLVLDLGRSRETFDATLGARPIALALDPEFRVLRRLAADEAPPILRQLMVATRSAVAVIGAGADWSAAARRLALRTLDTRPRFLAAGDAPPADTALLAIGRHGDIDAWLAAAKLPARPAGLADTADAQVWAASRPGGAPLVVVSARDGAALDTVARLMPHYGQQSFLVFEGERVAKRGVWPSQAVAWRFE
ncbi:MAG: M1 family peptidase [Burkholderiales bacterium]|nr:M1 family peptidase [Burkholderiales bacterium]